VEVLAAAVRTAPLERRDEALEELAHALLRVDGSLRPWPPAVVELIHLRVRTEPTTAGEALHVAAALDAVRRRAATMDAAFHSGPPVRLRARADTSQRSGPDELSPLRDPAAREAVVAAHRALAEAEYMLARELGPGAADLYVRALTERPGMPEAIEGLARLAAPAVGGRLEDVLEAATQLLAGLPPRVLGVPLEGVAEALADVIAARERLVRPLTIAVMGEFSSGKSTFVNALLGEAVAPMGVLPTTNTINLFRRGPSRGARIHRRDGSVETLAAEHVEPYLQGLDEVRAASIRHVEIERTGGRMGDAAVVDTPGLHALDPFHEQVARGFIEQADAIVWVFSATRGGAASEAAMLAALHAGGRQVLGVLNKVDTLDDAELSELLTYLRNQLGEVLVDVIPVCARAALTARIEQSDDSGGGVAAVEAALEQRFLARARELKQGLAQRGVREALLRAREAVEQTALALEARAQRAEPPAAAGSGSRPGVPDLDAARASATLRAVADGVADAIGEVADPWLREALGLGVLVTGKGRARGPLDPQDRRYLDEVVRDACDDALRRGIAATLAGAEADLWSTLIDERFVPWAMGFVAGALAQGLVPGALDNAGAAIVRGEAAARAELRQALAPVADALRAQLRGSTVELERELARRMRRRAGAPSAEALRLRSTVVPAIETLAAAAQASGRETVTGPADGASLSP
jgi:GTPase SAR1 family protein